MGFSLLSCSLNCNSLEIGILKRQLCSVSRTCLCLAPKRLWELEKPETPLVRCKSVPTRKELTSLHAPRVCTRERHALTPAVLADHLMSARLLEVKGHWLGFGGGHHGSLTYRVEIWYSSARHASVPPDCHWCQWALNQEEQSPFFNWPLGVRGQMLCHTCCVWRQSESATDRFLKI